MRTLHKALQHLLTFGLIAALSSSCSAQAKKERFTRRADEYFKAGDYEKAKLEYMNSIRIDERDPEPYERLGTIWLDEGAPLRGLPFLARAKELAPARAAIRAKLAELFMALSSLEDARKEALEALQIDPANDDALFVLADAARTPEDVAEVEQEVNRANRRESVKLQLSRASIAARKNDSGAMEAALSSAVAADPKSPVAHMALGRLRQFQNKKEEAAKEFKLAAEAAPPRSTAHLQYAEFLAQNGSTDEAIAYLNEIVRKAPDFLSAWVLLARFTAPKNPDNAIAFLDNVFRRDPQNLDARMMESDLYAKKGEVKRSVEILRQLDAAYPKVPLIKFQLSRALSQTGDIQQAISTLEQTIALAPNYGDAVLLLAELNLRSRNFPAVVKSLENFLKVNPDAVRAQVMLADAYQGLGRFDDAAAILRKQTAAAPTSSQAHVLLGVLLRQQGKIDEARAEFEKAYALGPDNLFALSALIDLDLAAKDYDKALQRVNAVAARAPDSAPLVLLQAKIYLAKGEWDKAEAAAQKVLQLKGDVAAASTLLVGIYAASNQLPKAIARTEEFLKGSPKDPGALMTLALMYTQMKDFPKARDAYERLLAVFPNALAMNNVAYIYQEYLNDLDKALDWANKARALDPTNLAFGDTAAWVLYKRGDYRQAATVLKEIAEKAPDQPEIQYHWGMANYMMGNAEAARTALQSAANAATDFPGKEDAKQRLALLDDARSEQLSIPELQSLTQKQPNDPLALSRLAEALAKKGSFEEAAAIYERALQVNAAIPAATLKLAELYAGPLHKKDRALEVAKKARELAPDNYHASALLGRLAFDSGNYTWSYSLLQDAARRAPADPVVLNGLAWAAYALGKSDEAEKNMQTVVRAAPDSPEGKDAKLFIDMLELGKSNDPSASESRVSEALHANPDYTPALVVMAAIQTKKGDAAAAKATYERLLSRFPEFAPAQKSLAQLLSADPATAARAYELAMKARAALPNDAEVARTLGALCYGRREYARSVQLLQETGQKLPLGAHELFYLGMSQKALKQRSAAEASLRRAIDGGLAEPEAKQAKDALDDIAGSAR